MAHPSLMRNFYEQQKQLWLIVEWEPESAPPGDLYGLVCSDSLSEKFQLGELHTGKKIEVIEENGLLKKASIVIVSTDKPFLEMEIKHLKEVTEQIDLSKGTSSSSSNTKFEKASDSEREYFQASDSEWNPNSDCGSDDATTAKVSKSKSNSYTKRKRPENTPKKIPKRRSTRKSMNQTSDNSVQPINGHQLIDAYNLAALSEVASYERPNSVNDNNCSIADNFDSIINNSKQRLTSSFMDVTSTVTILRAEAAPMTFDQQTQTMPTTDDKTIKILLENQKLLQSEMLNLYKILNDLKEQMDNMQKIARIVNAVNNKYKEVVVVQKSIENVAVGSINSYGLSEPRESTSPINNGVLKESNSFSSDNHNGSNSNQNHFYDDFPYNNAPQYSHNVPFNVSENSDMIPIGSGKTEIPRHIFSQIKWNSYTNATRQLLMAVFPRRTLATHSLTGKPSPAFTDKTPKLQLDAKKISDIIITVTRMCRVPENLVRSIITTKCSDENKMYKQRQKKLKSKNNSQDSNVNRENESENE